MNTNRESVDRDWRDFGGEVGSNCRFCEERHVGCHSTCEKCIQAKQKHDEFKGVVSRNKDRELTFYRYKTAKMKRENRKSEWDNKKGGKNGR